MKKYVNPNMSLPHCQSVIRHLVSTNVLLKEQLDKQTEEKKALRKKLLQMEKVQSDKDKLIAKKEQDFNEMAERLRKIEQAYHHNQSSDSVKPQVLTSTPKSTISILIRYLNMFYLILYGREKKYV
jgi:chromosome segregation ATPase